MASKHGDVPRRSFLGTALAGMGATAPAAAAVAQAGRNKPPNVLVIFTDQQRWDSVGAYGCPLDLTPNLDHRSTPEEIIPPERLSRLTPNIDRLAARGVRFEHAFTSQPVCGPARSSIQTGKYATTTGVIHNGLVLKDDEQTMAHYFKRHGYQTGYVGKWHLGGSGTKPVPLERRGGYDEWWTASDILEFTSTPFEGKVFDADNHPIHFSNYRVDAMTDLAVKFLRQRKSQPFYLFLSYLEPHFQNSTNTFVAPHHYADRYRNAFYIPPDLAPYPGDWKSQLPDYYGIIARIDECVGRLMKELEDQGIADDTLVVFTSDHGCHFRTRNREYKRSCHEGPTHVPMILRGPGFTGGRVAPELVSLVDLAPSLLDAAGISVPSAIQGRSFTGLARGDNSGWRDEVFIQTREVQLGRILRTRRWKYCVWDPENRDHNAAHSTHYTEHHFYDLLNDPGEHVNLIGRGDYHKIGQELAERLIARIKEAGEPEPTITPARHFA